MKQSTARSHLVAALVVLLVCGGAASLASAAEVEEVPAGEAQAAPAAEVYGAAARDVQAGPARKATRVAPTTNTRRTAESTLGRLAASSRWLPRSSYSGLLVLGVGF
jgi:hypothetical protein